MHHLIRLLFSAIFIFISPYAISGTWQSQSISGMSFELYMPHTRPIIDGKRALMISLHGCLQTADDLKIGGNWEKTANKHGMVVVLPRVRNGGVYLGCWDYYGPYHTRNTGHEAYLLRLVEELLDRKALEIDLRQIYITGLSSGGAEAMVMGCVAPDLFAGVGAVAGPAVGTTAFGYSYLSTTKEEAAETCRKMAGSTSEHFSTQLSSFLFGTEDHIVAQEYAELNAQAMAFLYGLKHTPKLCQAHEKLWSGLDKNPRISLLAIEHLGHAWPAGAAPGGPHIDPVHFDYPSYVTKFFFKYNRRIKQGKNG